MHRMAWKMIAAAGAALAASGAASAQTDALLYVIEGPGNDLPGSYTDAWAVSPDGGVVVGRTRGELTPGSEMVEGAFYRWTPSGGMELLRLADGTTSEQDIRGASHDGSRVFGVQYNPSDRATLSAWYWTEDPAGSGMGPVAVIPDDPYYGSELHAGSADGSVMVGYYNAGTFLVPSPNRREALAWSETGGYQTLPYADPSHTNSWAMDCSDDGTIAVGLSNESAVIWDITAGTVTDMNVGTLGGLATAVSANGQYAAGARTIQDPFFGSFLSKGFKWDAVGGVQDLDPSGFSNLVVPTAVSNDGQTVVGAESSTFYDAPGGPGFIWTAAGGYQPFDDYVLLDITVTNENISGWRFQTIRDMSPDGNIFVGDAWLPDGRSVGFVLYVGVEPPTCACELDGADGVDVFDLLAYLDLWFAGDARADIDGAAGVDVFDLLAFLDCWFPASSGAPC